MFSAKNWANWGKNGAKKWEKRANQKNQDFLLEKSGTIGQNRQNLSKNRRNQANWKKT
jgi:hypothetical protein